MSQRNDVIKDIVSELKKAKIPALFRSEIIKYIELIHRHVEISGIIIYGSVAYGHPTINSDIDLIVISPEFDKPYRELVMLKRKIAPKKPSRISSIWLGEKEVVRVFEGLSGFLLDALYFGIILLDKKGILKQLRIRMKKAIQQGYIQRKLGMWRILTKRDSKIGI